MARHLGNAAMDSGFPAGFACGEVDRVDAPGVFVGWYRKGLSACIETSGGLFVTFGADGCVEEDLVVPNDGRRPAFARDGCLPGDILGGAPDFGQAGVVGDRSGGIATEVCPAACLRGARGQGGEEEAASEGHVI